MSAFEAALEFVQLAALGVLLWEAQDLRRLFINRGPVIRVLEERMGRLENKIDTASERYAFLERLKIKGPQDPS